MNICFFGSYDKNYSKNVVLLKGFKKKGVKIIHCHHPNYFTPTHYPSLFWQFVKKAQKADIIFIAFFGHYDVWFAWILGKIFHKKVVFDPLISVYNTRIEDRKYFKPESLRAKFYKAFDWVNVHLADLILLDTKQHFKYFNKMFGLSRNKMAIVRVGADEEILIPTKIKLNKSIRALFYGSYQPSQGALKIIQVASLLKKENLEWIFIGNGQQRPEVEGFARKNKLKKVVFLNSMSFNELVKQIDNADIVFGVFGDTIKTKMVIHNKIYQGIAMGKVLITQNTKAVREILNDDELILVEPNILAINVAIKKLIKSNDFIKIGQRARKKFLSRFTTEYIANRAIKEFLKLKKNNKIFLSMPSYALFLPPLKKTFNQLGFQTYFYDYRHGDLIAKTIRFLFGNSIAQKYIELRILQIIYFKRPGIFLTIKGEMISRALLLKIRELNVKAVNWFPDPMNQWSFMLNNASNYDYFFHFDPLIIKKLKQIGLKNIYYLPFAAEIEKKTKTKKLYDISFIGTYSSYRERYLSALNNFNVCIWGDNRWYKSSVKGFVKGGRISIDEMRNISKQTKVNINLYHDTPKEGVNLRTFQVTGWAPFLLTEYVKDLDNLFSNHVEIETFKSPKDLKQKALFYLNHEQQREKIASKGYLKSKKKHNYTKRIQEMLNIIYEK